MCPNEVIERPRSHAIRRLRTLRGRQVSRRYCKPIRLQAALLSARASEAHHELSRKMMLSVRAITIIALVHALLACTPKEHIYVSAPAGGWIPIFNGKDLNDWVVKIAGHDLNDNYSDTFRVEDRLLKVSYQKYDRFGNQFGSLFYKKSLSHYWIRAEYRFVGDLAKGAPSWAFKNSGIQLHSQAPESMRKDQEFPVCVEFDLVGGRRFGSRPTGDVCQTGTRVRIDGVPLEQKCSGLSDVTIPDDQWVTVEAEIQGGKHVRQIVNGVLVVDYTDLQLDAGDPDARALLRAGAATALTSGFISLQSNGHPIEFRRIEILPLDAAQTM